MKTLLVPKFKNVWPVGWKHDAYEYERHVEVKIHNKPTSDDYQKVTRLLPGMACGYCHNFYNITKTREQIPITHFYDRRQSGVNKLKNYFITLKN